MVRQVDGKDHSVLFMMICYRLRRWALWWGALLFWMFSWILHIDGTGWEQMDPYGGLRTQQFKFGNLSGCDVRCNSTTNSGKLREACAHPRLKAISFASLAVKVIWLCLENACWPARTAETISAARPVWAGERVAMPTWQASRIVTASTLDNGISAKRVKRGLSVKSKRNDRGYASSAKKTNSSLLFIFRHNVVVLILELQLTYVGHNCE